MNLRAITARAAGIINPPTVVTLHVSDGYTTDAAGHRTPKYRIVRGVHADVQELSERDIFHVDMLNVGGSTHTIYLMGRVDGLVRPDNKGGDLIEFRNQTWLITGVLESFPGWCKVAATLQRDK